MAKVNTTVSIEQSLKKEAQDNKIPLGKTLEEALKVKLDKDRLIDDKKEELKILRRKARVLEKEIKELEDKRKVMKEKYGDRAEREQTAEDKLIEIDKKQGFIDDENIRAVSRISGLTVYEVEEIWKRLNK